jgi:hypothetical protein
VNDFDLALGDELTRDERRERFGGSLYGGIEPSRKTPNVFIYTDPAVGERHGYSYDGWVDDDEVFQYTGEGREGDQRIKVGNKALLTHSDDDRKLRVFAVNGVVAGTRNTKRQLYIGEFETDAEQPYFRALAPDDEGEPRSVLVFRLRPVGESLVRDQDRCPNNALPQTGLVEPVDFESWVEDAEVEGIGTEQFERKPMESIIGKRREAALVERYKTYLERQGHTVRARKIHTPDSVQPLRVDLFDETTQDLCEAKSSATRINVRYALGQILDYSRVVTFSSRSVLLPTRPHEDLLDLLVSNHISCVYETSKGVFERIDPEIGQPS